MEGNGKAPALKLNVFAGFPSYGGNGGIAAEHPDIRNWWCQTLLKMKADPRIGEIWTKDINDCPITMVRNRFVRMARDKGAHLLLMVDSDQSPDKHAGEFWYKPFWDVAFDELYKHYSQGPLVMGAPYCGPPGSGENVYVFQFDTYGNAKDESVYSLEQYTRAEAAKMSGVSEVAALPTGLILFDMRIFDLLEPSKLSKEEVLQEFAAGRMTKLEALAALEDGWFYYEWKNQYADEKASTEDVASTRNMAFACINKLGYNPLRCSWDSWIGHHKPWNVGKPAKLAVEQISANFRKACEDENSGREVMVDFGHQWPESLKPKVIADIPRDFPGDLLEALPEEASVRTREVFGRKLVTINHKTHDDHLAALREFVRDMANMMDRKLRVIEVGSWMGEAAAAIYDYCQEICCVDNWSGPSGDNWGLPEASEAYRRVFAWNTRNMANMVPYEGDSLEVAARFTNGPVDLIIIDADHSYESTKADIEAWMPHLKPSGTMIGHDYGTSQFPGVAKAVEELFDEYRVIGERANCGAYWVARKEAYGVGV